MLGPVWNGGRLNAEQFRDGLAEDFPGQVPQRDVDAAQDAGLASALGIGVEHVVEVHLNGQRVLAEQAQVGEPAAFERGDDVSGEGAVGAAGAVAGDAGVGLDLDQGAGVFHLHGFDGGDFDLVADGGRQSRQGGQRCLQGVPGGVWGTRMVVSSKFQVVGGFRKGRHAHVARDRRGKRRPDYRATDGAAGSLRLRADLDTVNPGAGSFESRAQWAQIHDQRARQRLRACPG